MSLSSYRRGAVWQGVAGMALSAALSLSLVAPAAGEIELADNLTIDGFIDMSTVFADDGDDSTVTGGVDQMEVDFHLDFGEMTARIDINSLPTGVEMEEAHVVYTPEDMKDIGLSVKVGRFLSTFGWETAEPTGLYQFSVSEGIPYPGYQNGVAVSVAPDEKVGLYVAAMPSVWDVTETDWETIGFEGQVAVMPVPEVTAKVGFAAEDMGDYYQSELNAWATFTTGDLTLAGEIDLLSNWGADGEAGLHFLGMANYALTEKLGVTGRFSGIDMDSAETSTEVTVSPGYAVNDNWFLLAEFRRNLDAETTQVAVEQIFTF
ncbi:outer membrane beta-barrel protein [Candidatus Poribacteria bacterium]|jgi:hypothetical protein|nr:outer membrane beta-barrel protein [Candidatus Poribacteria bacterium]MBT5531722.1 outer membrane beta-barrel protein [Candidatus Poribacteria bacterium]MBT5713924.1 outer membrane beta-barrel protein [Candidatus Poribacteria bacterium]MBT7096909.1 outer membrane beta-barrel protein [Candidatus Poribacteria bacterium]MBT7808232.1 outer membrane beta-barrel protein [Candidatus Poribacteria bacterium]